MPRTKSHAMVVLQLLQEEDEKWHPSVFYISINNWEAFELTFTEEQIRQYSSVGYSYNPYIKAEDICLSFRGKPVFRRA